jgi:hypothetical protein
LAYKYLERSVEYVCLHFSPEQSSFLFWCQPIKTATWNPASIDLLKCWKGWLKNFLVCGTGIWTHHHMLAAQILYHLSDVARPLCVFLIATFNMLYIL